MNAVAVILAGVHTRTHTCSLININKKITIKPIKI